MSATMHTPGSTLDVTAEQFIPALWPDPDRLPPQGRLNIHALPTRRSRWFAPSDVAAAATAARRIAETANAYIGTALIDLEARVASAAEERETSVEEIDQATIRGTAESALAIPGVWLDVDVGTDGVAHKRTDLPPDVPTFLAFLHEAMPLRATITLDSGHGVQPWWLFPEPWVFDSPKEREDAADLLLKFQYTFRERMKARGWALDSTHSLAQVLRIPGTWNRKPRLPAVPVTAIDWDLSRRYSVDALEQYLLDEGWERGQLKATSVELPDQLPDVDVDSLRVPPWIRDLIRLGTTADPERYKQRFRVIWRVMTELMESGYDDATVAAVLMDPGFEIGNKVREQGRRARSWVKANIGKARAAYNAQPRLNFKVRSSASPPAEGGRAPTVAVAVRTEGILYTAPSDPLRLLLTPKRKNRWQVTLQRDGAVLDTSVLDPADKGQREKLLKGVEVPPEEQDALRGLVLHAGLHAAKDTERWILEQSEDLQRAITERDAARKQAREAQRETFATKALAAGRAVLEDPALLYRVGETARALGLAGEHITVRLSYLIVTSRVGSKPINAAVKGGSSGGKSFTVATVLRLFPESAFWTFTTMSAKALIYVDEDFAHRYIVIYEQHGGEDADYFIRTLQSEGHLKHLVTQKQPDGTFVAVPIEKEGPTGFVTTTTRTALHDENETRIWSISIDESEAQTGHVLDSVASRYNAQGPQPDLEPWKAAQEWLGLAGATAAHVPYSHWLAERMPNKPLRIRRDFGRLLALIEASAVLFQRQRRLDEAGRVIATVHDYANAHALVADVFKATQEGITKRTNEILEMLQVLYEEKVAGEDASEVTVSYEELMNAASIGKPAISKHIAALTDLGLVENLETRERAAARLRPRLELLAPGTALPIPAELAAAFPELGEGVWVHPLSGEARNFLPVPPGNSGKSMNDEPPPGEATISARQQTGMETPTATTTIGDTLAAPVGGEADGAGENGSVFAAVSVPVSMPVETGRPGGAGGSVSIVSVENRGEDFVDTASLCRCGNPLSPKSAERCAPCAAAWEVWASVAIWGDRVVCPTCDRLADDDLYPSDDGELRCRQCIDDERSAERDEEDG